MSQYPEWQSIDTAPRDGTEIDIFTVHGDRITNAWFDPDEEYYPWKSGYYMPRAEEEVTHWMPLPPPPNQ